jgi:oxygen-independent coproporphyrinogen-3 oxidase
MSGIYLHIPFCKKACYYCDFHFSISQNNREAMMKAMNQEIILRKDYLENDKEIESIYFGGGTPSLLNESELSLLFETIHQYYKIQKNIEITLEANPDDINKKNLEIWKKVGINRLSIGIQTFNDTILKNLNRSHNAQEALFSVKNAQEIGLENISIDLMYALPTQNESILKDDLEKALALQTPHISAYCLTIEEKTIFGKWLKQQKIKPIEEENSALHFEILSSFLKQNQYEQYEISNFAKDKKYAIHNSNYWKQKSYIGIGASAHSYNQKTRQFNISNNALYIKNIFENKIPATLDNLSLEDSINEYLLTGLRTIWGVDLQEIQSKKGINFLELQQKTIENLLTQGFVILKNEHLFLSENGKLLADEITVRLFL